MQFTASMSIGLLPPMRCCPGGWGRCQLDHLFRWVLRWATKGHVEVPEKNSKYTKYTKIHHENAYRHTVFSYNNIQNRYIYIYDIYTIEFEAATIQTIHVYHQIFKKKKNQNSEAPYPVNPSSCTCLSILRPLKNFLIYPTPTLVTFIGGRDSYWAVG